MKQLNIDIIQTTAVQVPNKDAFNFLNQSGRKKYYSQGYYGQDTIVAVIDSGVTPHPELEDRLLQGTYFVQSGLCTKDSSDDMGHGTHVAGTIVGKNCGIAPKAKILPIKVFNALGEGTVDDVIKALEYVLQWRDSNGKRVDIVNMSLSCSGEYLQSVPWLLQQYEAAINNLVESGIAVIVASGNTGAETILYPACFQEVITVGAVDINKKSALFSTLSKEVDLCQIGVDVLSANRQGGYIAYNGTSMATPHVAGIAALMVSKYKAMFGKYMPEATLYEILKLNTIDLAEAGVDMKTGAGFCTLNPTISKIVIKMQDGNHNVIVNGETIVSPVAPYAVPPGHFVVPARVFTEAIGGQASWDLLSKTATFEIEV
jgi:major intracellular serine protease